MATYVFTAFFTENKVGVAPASAPTVDVCNSAGTLVVTDGVAVALTGIIGLYRYAYTTVTAGDYVAVFKTATTTVDAQHVLGRIDNEADIALLDVGTTLARMAKLDNIGSSTINVAMPFVSDEDLVVHLGNDYYAADGRSLDFDGDDWPSITGAVVTFTVYGLATTAVTGTVLTSASCRIELSKANVTAIGVGFWNYTLKVVLTNTHTITLVNGTLAVMEL